MQKPQFTFNDCAPRKKWDDIKNKNKNKIKIIVTISTLQFMSVSQ
jgi:hypothetical protein